MTVLSYPLAIYSGYFLFKICSLLRNFFGTKLNLNIKESIHTDVAFSLLILVIICLGVPDIFHLSKLQHNINLDSVKKANWIKQNTPKNAFIFYLNEIAPSNWVPYLTWWQTTYTPIPASENREMLKEKDTLFFEKVNYKKIKMWLKRNNLLGYAYMEAKDGSFKLRKF